MAISIAVKHLKYVFQDRAVNPENRFSSSVTLTVNVIDSDDQPPRFINEGYMAKVISGINSGPLQVSPEKIHAEDQDTLRSSVEYEFVGGIPTDFRNFFTINFQTGIVTQIAPVSRTSAKEYNISVKATEVSRKRLSAETFLVVKIMAEDLSPPVLTTTAEIGIFHSFHRIHKISDLNFRANNTNFVAKIEVIS